MLWLYVLEMRNKLESLLKRWNTAKEGSYFTEEGGMEEESEAEDVPEWKGDDGKSRMGSN